MVDETVGIKVTADAAGAEAGAEQANEAVNSIGATVKGLIDLFLELGGAATGSFREIRTVALEAAESVKGAAETVVEMREAIAGLGEALIAAFALEQITEFAKKMGETAESALHSAQTFGLTVGEVQRMNAVAALAGVSSDVLTTAMMRLDKSFAVAKEGGKQQAAAFKEVGISLAGSYTQTQLLNSALEGLSHMDAGPAKVAAAMAIFGRNIQGLGPLLNMTSEQIAENKKLIDEYGAVNEVAAGKGIVLAEAFNQNHVAMMGLNNVLTDGLAPAFTQIVLSINDMVKGFVDSYNKGGDAKKVVDGLAISAKVLAESFVWVGAAAIFTFETIDGAIWNLQGNFSVAFTDMVDDAKVLGVQLKTLGLIALEALEFDFGDIVPTWEQGIAEIERIVKSHAKNIATAMAAIKKGDAEWAVGDDAMKAAQRFHDKLWGPTLSAKLPKEGTGTTTDDPNKDGNNKGLDLAEILGPIRDFQAELIAGMHKDYLDSLQDGLRQSVGMYQRDAEARVALDKAAVSQIEQNAKGGVISHAAANEQIKALYTDEMDTKIAAANEEYNTTKTTVDESLKWVAIGTSEYERLQREEVEAKVRRDKAILEAQTANTVALIANDNTETQRLRQQWQGIISPIVSAWGSGLKGMIEGTQSFGQAMAHIGESILDVFLKVGERMVENWLVNLLVVKTASRATALGELSHNAVVAAGAAYASTAAIPIIGPFLAPLAGAAAFTAVMAFGELASAQGGFDIPAGVNPLVQTHAEEMILPASIANPLRDMLAQNDNAAPGGGFYGAEAAGGGDAHLHLHGNIIDGPSVGRWFDQNKHHVLGAVNSATRAGGTLKTG